MHTPTQGQISTYPQRPQRPPVTDVVPDSRGRDRDSVSSWESQKLKAHYKTVRLPQRSPVLRWWRPILCLVRLIPLVNSPVSGDAQPAYITEVVTSPRERLKCSKSWSRQRECQGERGDERTADLNVLTYYDSLWLWVTVSCLRRSCLNVIRNISRCCQVIALSQFFLRQAIIQSAFRFALW